MGFIFFYICFLSVIIVCTCKCACQSHASIFYIFSVLYMIHVVVLYLRGIVCSHFSTGGRTFRPRTFRTRTIRPRTFRTRTFRPGLFSEADVSAKRKFGGISNVFFPLSWWHKFKKNR